VLAAFWSGLGGELAKQWAARVLSPALAFWTGGLALVWWSAHGDDVRDKGWAAELKTTARPLDQLPTVAQLVVIIGALVLVAASGLIAERLTLPLLKLLEGYWARPLWLRGSLVRYRRWRRRRWAARVEPLRIKEARGDLSIAELEELQRLEAADALSTMQLKRLEQLGERRRRFTATEVEQLARGASFLRGSPREDPLGMPTRLGDLLRAAERRPYDKYGLDAVVCWYRLWLLLPEEVKIEISEARLELDRAMRAWLWGALFLVWTPWLWWVAVPIGILVPLLAYNFSMLNAAALFGDLVETAFDLHRMRLYDALLLPRPTSPADERLHGTRLSRLLWRGETDPAIVYATPPPPDAHANAG
jgi:hypothetical protein